MPTPTDTTQTNKARGPTELGQAPRLLSLASSVASSGANWVVNSVVNWAEPPEARLVPGVADRGVPRVAAPATVVQPGEVLPVVEPEPVRELASGPEGAPPPAEAGLAAEPGAAAGPAAAAPAAGLVAAGTGQHRPQQARYLAMTPVTRRER